ncbi:MAG: oligosaccharide flippase family protein [Burkholderiaceae bacterium]|nr:oligosaccharide flippase family protein [Burkholderiaceae bacterium]
MIAKNIAYLYVIQLLRLCLPLALLSILTGVLTEPQYSVYVYTLATSAWLSILVEYGFNVSATRRIAAAIAKPEATRAVIVETQSAKWMLAGASLLFLVWALAQSTVFASYEEWALCAWLLGVMIGMTPTYYYQGTSSLRIVAVLEVVGGLLTFASAFFLVRSSADFGVLCLTLIAVRLIIWQTLERRMFILGRLRFSETLASRPGRAALRDGWQIFLVQAAASLYTSFNVVLLGGISSPYAVALYGSSERLIRAGLAFIAQASSAIFPKLNALKANEPEQLGRIRRLTLIAFTLGSLASLPLLYLLAPTISEVLFNNKLPDLPQVIRTMSLVIPAIAISNVLAMQFLVVDHQERILNRVVFSAVPISLVCGYALSLSNGATGMATAWVAVEWYVSISLAAIVYRRSKRSQ